MSNYYKFSLFFLIFAIAIFGLVFNSLTGHQVLNIPELQHVDTSCPLNIEVLEYSPDNYFFKTPLITGYSTIETCRDVGTYHIKVNDKMYQKFECAGKDVITFRSCSTGFIFLNGVLNTLELDEDSFYPKGFYQGSWKCAQGQNCVVEKKSTGFFRGCESQIETKPTVEKPVELEPLKRTCDVKVTYIDFKTELKITDTPGQTRIFADFGEKKGTQIRLELKEQKPGIYTRTLIFREPKIYELAYKNHILPIEVEKIPGNIRENKLKNIKEKSLEKLKKLLTSII